MLTSVVERFTAMRVSLTLILSFKNWQKRRATLSYKLSSLRALSSESSALLSRPSSMNAPSSKPKLKLICSYCRKLGHIKEKCYRRNRDLWLARDAPETTDKALIAESSSTSTTGPSSISMEQLQVDLAHLTSMVSSIQSPSMASFENFGMSFLSFSWRLVLWYDCSRSSSSVRHYLGDWYGGHWAYDSIK